MPSMMDGDGKASAQAVGKRGGRGEAGGRWTMPGIANMIDLIARLESPDITVRQERCVLVRNRNAACLRCAEACTSGCISYDGERLTISPERCIGCGTCATACPTCALEAHRPNDAQLMERCSSAASETGGLVCLACAQLLERARGRYDVEKVVPVACLGRVEESLLTGLASRGAEEIVLVGGGCEACEHANGWDMAKLVCRTEERLLRAWRSSARVRLARKLPAAVRAKDEGYDKGKRASFAAGGCEAAHAGAAALHPSESPSGRLGADAAGCRLKVMEDGTLPHFIPDRRERLLDALASMGQPQDVMVDTRLWGHVVIDVQRCSSCRMCATFCPTGAIAKFQDEDGTFGIEHYPGDCVKCRCCATICPEGALTLSEEVFAVDMLAGMVDRYEMRPPAVRRDQPHAIWHTMKTMMKTDQVYER